MATITKELAEKIARKLEARVAEKGKAHDIASVWVDSKLVATFGIRRGSKKDAGHDHIPSQLHVSPRDAKLLGQCPLTRDAWIDLLRAKGLA